MKQRDKTQYS